MFYKNCKICKNDFETNRYQIKYCSASCKNKAICERRKKYRKGTINSTDRLALIFAYKSKHPCVGCGETDSVCLLCHHRNPATKSFTISDARKIAVSLVELEAELKKCDVMCFNCHMKHHSKNPVSSLIGLKRKQHEFIPRKFRKERKIIKRAFVIRTDIKLIWDKDNQCWLEQAA